MGSTLAPDCGTRHRTRSATSISTPRKARRVLGWTPAFTLDAGLRETVHWYKGALRWLTGIPW